MNRSSSLRNLMKAQKGPDYRKRRSQLREAVSKGCLLLFKGGEHFNENLYYLTGLDTFYTLALLSLETDHEYVLTNPIEFPVVRESCDVLDVRSCSPDSLISDLTRLLRDLSPSVLYSDYAFQSRIPLPAELVDHLRTVFPQLSIKPIPDELLRMRMIKDEFELATMRLGIEVIKSLFADLPPIIKPGVPEAEIASEIYKRLVKNGFNKFYDIFVASGPNSAIPFYRVYKDNLPTDGVVLIDICAAIDCYVCDMTRTFSITGNFSLQEQKLYSIINKTQQDVTQLAQKGATLSGLSRAAGDLFAECSVAKYYLGKVGHFVGLSPDDPGGAEIPLEKGMVLTVEPGLYLPEEGLGIRAEDMVFVD